MQARVGRFFPGAAAWLVTGMTAVSGGFMTTAAADVNAPVEHLDPAQKLPVDRSGHKRVGKASFYSKRFAGRKMADGTPMKPGGDSAASKTLPLGTTAKVTNLETGKSAIVTIRDRGPYVKGRILDVSPGTAQKIGIDPADGVAKVEVAPITVPPAESGKKD